MALPSATWNADHEPVWRFGQRLYAQAPLRYRIDGRVELELSPVSRPELR
jgi:hypothetical protein